MASRVVPEGGGEGDTSGKAAGVAPAPPSVAAGPAGPAGAWSPCWRSTAEPTTARTTMTTMTPIDAFRSQWDSLRGGVTCAAMGLLCTDAWSLQSDTCEALSSHGYSCTGAVDGETD